MNHSFNVGIATVYGVEEAIILENFYFWIKKNMANKKHFHDGTYWTYNTQSALSELFPYFNRQKIQRVLSKLEDYELIKKGNYNKAKYDRTTWYSLTEKGLKLFNPIIVQKWTMDCSKMDNGLFKSEPPIPDINTNINTDKDIVGKPDNMPYKPIIDYLNNKIGTNYRYTSKKSQQLIKARINEGFTENDFYIVIDKKVTEWKGTDMDKFIRPETLFGPKFESYLNQKDSTNKKQTSTIDSYDPYANLPRYGG